MNILHLVGIFFVTEFTAYFLQAIPQSVRRHMPRWLLLL